MTTSTQGSDYLGLKVRTFLNSPGNADFENLIIFNIRREKDKTVSTMTFTLTPNVSRNIMLNRGIS